MKFRMFQASNFRMVLNWNLSSRRFHRQVWIETIGGMSPNLINTQVVGYIKVSLYVLHCVPILLLEKCSFQSYNCRVFALHLFLSIKEVVLKYLWKHQPCLWQVGQKIEIQLCWSQLIIHLIFSNHV